MCFTVFNYMPFLEEETPGHHLEMSKKAETNNDTAKDGACDSDVDGSDDSDLYTSTLSTLTNNHSSNFIFLSKSNKYRFLFANTIIQPPKI